jgi:hypothetical protein
MCECQKIASRPAAGSSKISAEKSKQKKTGREDHSLSSSVPSGFPDEA